MLPVSARTGAGLADLRGRLAEPGRRSGGRPPTGSPPTSAAAAARAGRALRRRRRPGSARAGAAELVDALADAAGVPAVVSRRRAVGPPRGRGAHRLAAAALDRAAAPGPAAAGCTSATRRPRTSLPRPGAVAAGRRSTTALRRARDPAGEGLPQAWRDDLRRTARCREERLADRLDRAVAGTDLGPDRVPLWQRGVGALQWLLALTALAGALWLLGLVVLGWLQLDDVVPLPRVEGIPLPTLLLVGGLLAGALLALLARPLVRLGARRRARQGPAAAARPGRRRGAQTRSASRWRPPAADHDRFCAAVKRADADPSSVCDHVA